MYEQLSTCAGEVSKGLESYVFGTIYVPIHHVSTVLGARSSRFNGGCAVSGKLGLFVIIIARSFCQSCCEFDTSCFAAKAIFFLSQDFQIPVQQ